MNMKQSLAFLFFLLLGVATLGAQPFNRNQGSAPVLKGKIYVLTCFVSETGWTASEARLFEDMVLEAEEWLSAQAKSYGQEVSFQNASVGIEEPLLMDHIGGYGSDDELVDRGARVMSLLSYRKGMKFVKWVKRHTDCTGCLMLVAANQDGRDYSLAYQNIFDKSKYFLEVSMLYTSCNGVPTSSSSIAHEMCHLFGAEDLYAVNEDMDGIEQLARESFPEDIMLSLSRDNIYERKIDRLTAWQVGLTDEIEFWYLDLIP